MAHTRDGIAVPRADHTIFAKVPVPLVRLDVATDRIEVNEAFVRTFGYRPDEITSLAELGPRLFPDPDDLTAIRAAWAAARQLAETDGVEFAPLDARATCADGRVLSVIISAHTCADDYIIAYTDVTRLAEAEETLRRQGEFLSLAQRSARAGTWHWEMSTGRVDWSPELLALFGLDAAAPAPTVEQWAAMLHDDDREPTLRRIAASIERKESCDIEYRILCADGATRRIRALGTVWCDDDGTPCGMAGVCFDVTEQKALEEARREAERKARDAEQRFAFAVEGSGDGVWDWNPLTDEAFFSPRFNALAGWADGPTASTGEEWKRRVHPDDIPRVVAAMNAHFSGEIPYCEVDHRVRCDDGSYRWFSARGLLVQRDAEGRPTRMIGTIRDITDQRFADEELRRSRNRLEAANIDLARASRLKDELLATMTHELRTPLNAIIGISESLLEQHRGPLTERQKDSLRTVLESGNNLLAMIKNILDFSEAASGRLTLQLERVPLAEVCVEAIAMHAASAEKKNIRLGLQSTVGTASIDADPLRLRQILGHILNNAVKFTPHGGHVTLEVSVDTGAQLAEFAVRDTGIGMTAEGIDRLFEPFVQLDSGLTRQYEGAGMGLAVVRRLVDLHGGSIAVESEPGKGSSFTVRLPLRAGAHTPTERAFAARF